MKDKHQLTKEQINRINKKLDKILEHSLLLKRLSKKEIKQLVAKS